MDDVEIDVVGAEPAQALVHLRQNVLARQPATVGSFSHWSPYLGRDDDLVSRREVTNRAAEHFLALAVRVHVRSIEEVNACFERALDVRTAFGLAQRPRPLEDS